MVSPVYLIRQPSHTLSAALFSADSRDCIVVAIEQAVVDGSSSLIGEIMSPGTGAVTQERRSLTYHELLDVIMKAGKVITL